MLLAGMFFALMQVMVKFLPHIPAVEIVFFRSLFSLIFTYFLLRKKHLPIFGNNKKLLVMRGISGSIGLILFFVTLQHIPLASAVTIQYLSPVFTTLLGIFLVKEKVRPMQFLYFGLAFLGVMIIEGFDPRISTFYLVIGITSAFFSGLAYNIIRRLRNTEHPLIIVFYFPLVTLPIAFIYCIFHWVQPAGLDWLILLCVGIFTQFAQYYMTMAYQNARLSKIASLNYLGIVYALGFGFIFFNESFNLLTYFGMTLVLSGVILNIKSK